MTSSATIATNDLASFATQVMLPMVAVSLSIFATLSMGDDVASIVRAKTTGLRSMMPYVCAVWNACLACLFGVLLEDKVLVSCNGINFFISLYYSSQFYKYFGDKRRLRLVSALLAAVSITTFILCRYILSSDGSGVHIFGVVCNVATLFMFAAPLGNILHSVNTRKTDTLSFKWVAIGFACALSWFFYGLHTHNVYVWAPNLFGVGMGVTQLALFGAFGNTNEGKTFKISV